MIKKDWKNLALNREAIPKNLREETTKDFCIKFNVPESTYYEYVSKKESQAEIVKKSLNNVKKYIPEVLEKLGEKAILGDTKAIEMYLEYIVKLNKKLDITSENKIIYLPSEILEENGIK
ncbi:hypothetical protein EOM09_01630 [bacterium]|nr:hypothetical protein [bacterium]